jgi:capsular exopolysaccharide synthesis family protein
LLDDHLVSLRDPNSFEAEHYRLLRHRLELLRSNAGLGVVAVTSASVGDGKTTTAINLAGAMAQASSSRVLLVDADLRRPAVGERLGVGPVSGPGLVDAVLDSRLRLPAIVRRAPPLAILQAGNGKERPYEVLQSPRVGELMAEARELYDFVVLDLPPVLVLPDCRLVSAWVDGFVIVVGAHKTPAKLLAEALDVLDPGKVLGLVFNGDDRPLSGYYGYYRSHSDGQRPKEKWWNLWRYR